MNLVQCSNTTTLIAPLKALEISVGHSDIRYEFHFFLKVKGSERSDSGGGGGGGGGAGEKVKRL